VYAISVDFYLFSALNMSHFTIPKTVVNAKQNVITNSAASYYIDFLFCIDHISTIAKIVIDAKQKVITIPGLQQPVATVTFCFASTTFLSSPK
jgi:hypothetical protein